MLLNIPENHDKATVQSRNVAAQTRPVGCRFARARRNASRHPCHPLQKVRKTGVPLRPGKRKRSWTCLLPLGDAQPRKDTVLLRTHQAEESCEALCHKLPHISIHRRGDHPDQPGTPGTRGARGHRIARSPEPSSAAAAVAAKSVHGRQRAKRNRLLRFAACSCRWPLIMW